GKKSDCRRFNQERIVTTEPASAKRDKFPTDFSVHYFKPGHAWRRAAVGPGHAAGIEKQNATTPFIARDVCVTMQKNVDIIPLSLRRNVLQSEFQAASRKIDDKRPLEIAIAISAHKGDARSDRPQFVENRFRANVAKMPNFVGILGHFAHAIREPIVRVGENKDAPGLSDLACLAM